MKFARKVAAFAVTAVALSTVFIGVGAASAATPQAAPIVKTQIGPCDLPEVKVSDDTAKAFVADINPRACLDIVFVDKCDGTTVITMKNGAFSDNIFTVLKVRILGKDYTLKGGSDPNTETATVGPPGVEDLQVSLVFHFTAPDGSDITIVKPFGDPWTWEEPKGCVSPSPSASASASPSPSVTAVPTSAPATTTSAPGVPAPQSNDDGDLPVTGSALFGTISTGVGLVLAGIVVLVVIARRRRAAGN